MKTTVASIYENEFISYESEDCQHWYAIFAVVKIVKTIIVVGLYHIFVSNVVKRVIGVVCAEAMCRFNRWHWERDKGNLQDEENTTQMHLERRNVVVACTMMMAQVSLRATQERRMK